jgi:hypothetical protein
MGEPLDTWFKREILSHEEILVRFIRRVWPRSSEVADIRQEAYARVYEAARESRPHAPKARPRLRFAIDYRFCRCPTFSFAGWLSGLMVAISILFCMSPLAFRGTRTLRFIAYPYAVIMFLNGVQHIIGSLYLSAFMPGVWSAPILLLAAGALFAATKPASRKDPLNMASAHD